MITEQKNDSLGAYLQSARKARGLDVKALSAQTKISAQVIRQMENEEHEQLPDPAFVKGFLRLYSAAVGCDGQQALALYLESRERHEREMALQRGERNGGRFWLNMFISLGALGSIMTLSLYMIPESGFSKRGLESPEYTVEAMAPSSSAALSGENAADAEANPPEPAPEEKWLLNIHAVEDTWLKVLVDAEPFREYRLKRGDRLELSAADNVNLLLGSATAAKMTLNGKPVTIYGKSGQTVNLDLP